MSSSVMKNQLHMRVWHEGLPKGHGGHELKFSSADRVGIMGGDFNFGLDNLPIDIHFEKDKIRGHPLGISLSTGK